MVKKSDLLKALRASETEHFILRTQMPELTKKADVIYQAKHETSVDMCTALADLFVATNLQTLKGSLKMDGLARTFFKDIADLNQKLSDRDSVFRINKFDATLHVNLEISRFSKENGEYKGAGAVIFYLEIATAGLSDL